VAAQPLPTLLDLTIQAGRPVAAAIGAQYVDASAEASGNRGWQQREPCRLQAASTDPVRRPHQRRQRHAQQGHHCQHRRDADDGVKGVFQPFYQVCSSPSILSAGALQLSGDATQIGGFVRAERYREDSGFDCSAGHRIRFANADDRRGGMVRYSAAPAVTLNSFAKAGGHAAFNGRTQSVSTKRRRRQLTSPFAALAEVAVGANPLRRDRSAADRLGA
jgi:hypothetical protein